MNVTQLYMANLVDNKDYLLIILFRVAKIITYCIIIYITRYVFYSCYLQTLWFCPNAMILGTMIPNNYNQSQKSLQ